VQPYCYASSQCTVLCCACEVRHLLETLLHCNHCKCINDVLCLLYSGWTGERVLIVGDSAGANLAVAVAMKVAAEGIRKPDGILSIYGCLLIHYIPSPSRILALMDPLLPIGVLSLCLHGKNEYRSAMLFFIIIKVKI